MYFCHGGASSTSEAIYLEVVERELSFPRMKMWFIAGIVIMTIEAMTLLLKNLCLCLKALIVIMLGPYFVARIELLHPAIKVV